MLFIALPGEEQHFVIRVGCEDFSFDGMTFLMVPATLGQLEEIAKLSQRKDDLEERLRSLESGVYITSVSEIKDGNGNVIGMSFSLSAGEPIVVHYSDGIEIESGETEVTFTLPDGSVVVIPLVSQPEPFSFKIVSEGDIAVLHG